MVATSQTQPVCKRRDTTHHKINNTRTKILYSCKKGRERERGEKERERGEGERGGGERCTVEAISNAYTA